MSLERDPKPFWMVEFEKELGVAEIPGPVENPRILEYFKYVKEKADHTKWCEADAWCAAAMNWNFVRLGMAGIDSAVAYDFMKWGRPLKAPKRGCVVVLWRVDPDGWESHVGICNDVGETQIQLLAGNQGDKVCLKWYPLARVRPGGLRWPVMVELNTPERRDVWRFKDPVINPVEVKPGPVKEFKFKWYEKIYVKGLVSRVMVYLISVLRLIPKTAPLGDLLEGIFKQKEKSWVDIIIEFIQAIFTKLKNWRKK